MALSLASTALTIQWYHSFIVVNGTLEAVLYIYGVKASPGIV